jgi:hypothetical protein
MTRMTLPPNFSVPELFPRLADLARETVRLHPRLGTEPALDASKLGGEMIWPEVLAWPTCTLPHPSTELRRGMVVHSMKPTGNPYVGVLQLTRQDVPELGFPADADLFQLLWCPNDHEPLFGPVCRVAWHATDGVRLASAAIPSPPSAPDYLARACVLHPERVTEYPSVFELPDELFEPIRAWEASLGDDPIYQYQLSTAPGTKVGGHVGWIQDPQVPECEAGHRMEHLLTVESAEFDGGTWPRWLTVEESDAWSGPTRRRFEIQSAAGLMLGDMGALYVFICRSCADWPIATVVQSS